MLPGERHQKILEFLMKSKSISVTTLCELLEASEATIRRDLTALESEGQLERTHGGAILKFQNHLNVEASFNQKEFLQSEKKLSIAKSAFSSLKASDSIILDAGTTTLALARCIAQSDLKLQVLTNSMTFSEILSRNPNVDLFVVGGKVRLNTLATVGSVAVDLIKRFHVKKTFIGVNGLTLENGLTTPDIEEAETKRAMLTIGQERIVLADCTKFNVVAMCQIAPLSMVDTIITDTDTSNTYVEDLKMQGIEVILAR